MDTLFEKDVSAERTQAGDDTELSWLYGKGEVGAVAVLQHGECETVAEAG